MPSVVRMGVLGCASIALRRVLPAMIEADGMELRAVASRDPAKAHAIAERFGCVAAEGYDDLLDRPDIDAVYIPLPTGLHAYWASRAGCQTSRTKSQPSICEAYDGCDPAKPVVFCVVPGQPHYPLYADAAAHSWGWFKSL